MKQIVLALGLLVSASGSLRAQAPTAPATEGFFLQHDKMVLRMESRTPKAPAPQAQELPLSKDVTLGNNTRIHYQSGTVEYADGRQVVLKEGDFVTLNGDVTLAESGQMITAEVPAAFTYRPATPVGGKLRGVVELGASGFNSFIVRVDAKKRWKLEKAEFGNSLVMENLATEDDIRKGLKTYIGQMLDFGVGARDIHFVVSSGASKSENLLKIVEALKSYNYVVNVVSVEEEGASALRATMPPVYRDNAFVMDLGSANTKLSWANADGTVGAAETYGSKYFQLSITDSAAAADVRQKVQQVPPARRNVCFVLGGVPYELAKPLRQGQERYTVLKPAAYYQDQTAAKTKAGLNIYRALADATGCQQFVFDWETNFTIGYLLTLP